MLIGKIGSFKIETAESIAHSISQEWATKTRIGNNPARFAIGKYDESVSFTGAVLLEKNNYLDDLKNLVKDAKPVTLVIADIVYAMVVIEQIDFTKSIFLRDGKHIKEEFTINLKRYFDA
ncbi:phage tail protein [Aliarcobacter cryaerophilus]|uniref:phage tail protein n=1 Tax=Aliarcobacter cryaerophilus TaxID=28198 RepID=UPI0031809767